MKMTKIFKYVSALKSLIDVVGELGDYLDDLIEYFEKTETKMDDKLIPVLKKLRDLMD